MPQRRGLSAVRGYQERTHRTRRNRAFARQRSPAGTGHCATVDNTNLTLTATNGISGTYAADASGNGRGTATMNNANPFGSTGAVLYIIGSKAFLALGTTATVPVIVRFEQ